MTRVRVVGGPWPKRIGCEGQIVGMGDSPMRLVYVLLDEDPLCDASYGPLWSIVIDRSHLEEIK